MPYTALIMAASRKNEVNPLAEANGVSHKCLMDMDGVPMIDRVLASLTGSPHIGDIIISIDDPAAIADAPAVKAGMAEGRVKLAESGDNPYLSVLDALDDPSIFPVVVSTGDNAMHTADMVDFYCEAFTASNADVSVAFCDEKTILPAYLRGKPAPHRFRDDRFGNCNLFGLKSHKAVRSVKAFEGGGQFGKKKIRFFKAFGLVNLLIYKYGLLTLEQAFKRLSKRFKLEIAPIMMPFPEAPIDVDNPHDEKLARELLAKRREGAPVLRVDA
ncbi:MAG: NTP transferase domain-containing protein [Pseudomonadota bacterium]